MGFRPLLIAALAAPLVVVEATEPDDECPAQPDKRMAEDILRESGVSPDVFHTMLFRFKGEQGEGYLFGTVHLGPPYVSRPPPAAMLAIRQSAVFASEVIMDQDAQQLFLDRAVVQAENDRHISPSSLGATLYDRYMTAAAKRGIAPELAKSLTPWAAFLSIGRPAIPPGSSLDEQLQGVANRMQRQIVGLQSIDELVTALESISKDDQLAILKDTICQQSALRHYYTQLLVVYSSGVPEAVVAFSHAGRADDPLLGRLDKLLVVERNRMFLQRLLPLLAQGRVFLAVGAQHLAGPTGLVQQLRARGFSVERAP